MNGIIKHTHRCGNKRKYFVFVLVCIIMFICGCKKDATPQSFDIDYGSYTITYLTARQHSYCVIKKIKGECPEEFYIPETANGKKVKVILGNATWPDCLKNTKRLYLPEGMEYVDTLSLQGCYNLEYLYIGDNVKTIRPWFIESAEKLSEIETHNNPYYATPENLCLIDKSQNMLVFGTVSGYIPSDVKIIGSESFSYLEVTEIEIPEGVEEIQAGAFSYCRFLKQDIHLPDSVILLEDYAFCESAITGLSGGKYETIPRHLIEGCWNLTYYDIPDSVHSLLTGSLYSLDDTGLTEIIIPDSVVYAEDYSVSTYTIPIFCESEEKPEGWSDLWCWNNPNVTWGANRDE